MTRRTDPGLAKLIAASEEATASYVRVAAGLERLCMRGSGGILAFCIANADLMKQFAEALEAAGAAPPVSEGDIVLGALTPEGRA